MNKYEIIKELKFLYEAKRVLEKYQINPRIIDKRIAICLKNLKLLEVTNVKNFRSSYPIYCSRSNMVNHTLHLIRSQKVIGGYLC